MLYVAARMLLMMPLQTNRVSDNRRIVAALYDFWVVLPPIVDGVDGGHNGSISIIINEFMVVVYAMELHCVDMNSI